MRPSTTTLAPVFLTNDTAFNKLAGVPFQQCNLHQPSSRTTPAVLMCLCLGFKFCACAHVLAINCATCACARVRNCARRACAVVCFCGFAVCFCLHVCFLLHVLVRPVDPVPSVRSVRPVPSDLYLQCLAWHTHSGGGGRASRGTQTLLVRPPARPPVRPSVRLCCACAYRVLLCAHARLPLTMCLCCACAMPALLCACALICVRSRTKIVCLCLACLLVRVLGSMCLWHTGVGCIGGLI